MLEGSAIETIFQIFVLVLIYFHNRIGHIYLRSNNRQRMEAIILHTAELSINSLRAHNRLTVQSNVPKCHKHGSNNEISSKLM